jgi:radical SAM-linked protein
MPTQTPESELPAWRDALEKAGIDPDRNSGPLDPHQLPAGAPSVLPHPELLDELRRAQECEPTRLEERALAAHGAVEWVTLTAPAEAITAPAPGAMDAGAANFGRRGRRKTGPLAARTAERYRVRYARGEELRFTSHVDTGHAFERALRRLSLAPGVLRGRGVKMAFGPPLPLGMTSDDEYLDIVFPEDVPDTALAGLPEALPAGLCFVEMKPVRASVESLAQAIDRGHYRVTFPARGADPELAGRLRGGAAATKALAALLVARAAEQPQKTIDIRPGLVRAEVVIDTQGQPALDLELAMDLPGCQRPELFLPSLTGLSAEECRLSRIHRLALRIAGATRQFSPLEVVELDFQWWREVPRRRPSAPRP